MDIISIRKLLKDLDDEICKLEKELSESKRSNSNVTSVLGAVLKQLDDQKATFSLSDWISISKDDVIIESDSDTSNFTVRYRPRIQPN